MMPNTNIYEIRQGRKYRYPRFHEDVSDMKLKSPFWYFLVITTNERKRPKKNYINIYTQKTQWTLEIRPKMGDKKKTLGS